MKDRWDDRYLDLAKHFSTWSKDPSRQIGAVAIGSKGQVLSQGYNGFPRGIFDTSERYEDKPTKYKYVVHAEMNCIYNAMFHGTSLANSTLYVYGLPVCSDCAKGIIQVGITRVVTPKLDDTIPQLWIDSTELTKSMFREANVVYNFI